MVLYICFMLYMMLSSAQALTCYGSAFESVLCEGANQFCATFTFFGETYRGCIVRTNEFNKDNCDVIREIDNGACCCDLDFCNSETCINQEQRHLQSNSLTLAPTTNAISNQSLYCEAPNTLIPAPQGPQTNVSCNFGNSSGWTYVSNNTFLSGLTSCISIREATPYDYQNYNVYPSNMWCPTTLEGNTYDAETSLSWGICTCEPNCKVQSIKEQPKGPKIGPCDFGNENGWEYRSTSANLFSLHGCISIAEAPPNDYQLYNLNPNDLWCPTSLINGLYDPQQDIELNWAVCQCSPCRIIPNSPNPAFVSSGLCDFGPTGNWTYQFSNGEKVNGLTSCLDLNPDALLLPVGYPDIFGGSLPPLNSRWCPTQLLNESIYLADLTVAENGANPNQNYPISWGLCECVQSLSESSFTPTTGPSSLSQNSTTDQPTTTSSFPSTFSPSISPSAAPTKTPHYQGTEYCVIVNSSAPLTSGVCNLGTSGVWDYLGVSTNPGISSETTRVYGVTGCFSSSLGQPALSNSNSMGVDDYFYWCPGPSGLDQTNTYNLSAPNGIFWGVCECGQCAAYDYNSSNIIGLCGMNSSGHWTYKANGVEALILGCQRIEDYPPYGSQYLNGSDLWCPLSSGLINDTYDFDNSNNKNAWGLCTCLSQTDVSGIYSPTNSPIYGPSLAPSYSPSSASPTKAPSSSPSFSTPTLSPFVQTTTAPTPAQTICKISSVTFESQHVVKIGSICGFENGYLNNSWEFNDPSLNTSTQLSSCVSIGAFTPLGSDYTDFGKLWCPSKNGLSNNTYSRESPNAYEWGFCTCETCQVQGSILGDILPEACDFGTDGTWGYNNSQGTVNSSLAGCVSTTEFPPFGVVAGVEQLWCPISGGLDQSNIYNIHGQNDALKWAYCTCSPTLPPTPATKTPTFDPTVPGGTHKPTTSSPSNTPTEKPSESPSFAPYPEPSRSPSTYPTLKPSKSPTTPRPSLKPTSFPTTGFPTPIPSTQNPSFNPTLPGSIGNVALFIQADHSGSIRSANPLCTSETENSPDGPQSCWTLQNTFIRNLALNLMSKAESFRFYLSAFTCFNRNPINQILTYPALTFPDAPEQVLKGLYALENLGQNRMFATCPSLGVQQMMDAMSLLSTDWTILYVIVTDGRVNSGDFKKYRQIIHNMKLKYGVNVVCGATVGNSNSAELQTLLDSNCVFPALDFPNLASHLYSEKFSYALLNGGLSESQVNAIFDTISPTANHVVVPTQNFNTKTNIPTDSGEVTVSPTNNSKDETVKITATTGIIIVGAFAIGLVVVLRTKKSKIIRKGNPVNPSFWYNNPAYPELHPQGKVEKKSSSSLRPHRHPDPIHWISNPAFEGPTKEIVRKRSRADSDPGFFDLPPPPPPLLHPADDQRREDLFAFNSPSKRQTNQSKLGISPFSSSPERTLKRNLVEVEEDVPLPLFWKLFKSPTGHEKKQLEGEEDEEILFRAGKTLVFHPPTTNTTTINVNRKLDFDLGFYQPDTDS